MIISSLILGVGHIGIHMQHYKKLNTKKTNLVIKIMKGIMFLIFALVFTTLIFSSEHAMLITLSIITLLKMVLMKECILILEVRNSMYWLEGRTRIIL